MSKTRYRPLYAEVVAHNESLMKSLSEQGMVIERSNAAGREARHKLIGTRQEARELTQSIIEAIGSDGPESLGHAVGRALDKIAELEDAGKTYAANGNENAQGASGLYYTKGGG